MQESLAALDHIRLNFSGESSIYINIVLALMMFGVALDVKVESFRSLLAQPKILIAGVLSQAVVMPALTFVMVTLLEDSITVGVALGMILVAACPGGNISNFITSLAKGNVALAVSLTAISTMLAVVMTPFNFTLWGNLYAQNSHLLRPLSLDWYELFKSVMLILALPLALGMACAVYWPAMAARLLRPFRVLSLLFFAALVIIIFGNNLDIFLNHIGYVFILVLLQNALAMTTGYSMGKVFGLTRQNCRTLSIETGIHNSGLGLALLFNPAIFPPDLPLGGMTVIAGWWSIWHIVAGVSAAFYWRRQATITADSVTSF